MIYDVIVIGGGASGMMAAITAARNGKTVCIIESEERLGRKILATGNGKCNMTNMAVDASCYRSDSLTEDGTDNSIMNVIRRFDNKAVIDFFREEGLLVREREGYVYPYSEQAASVLDTLRRALKGYHAEAECGCQVIKLRPFRQNAMQDGGFEIFARQRKDKEEAYTERHFQGKRLILATGSPAGLKSSESGAGLKIAEQFGHHVIKYKPALVQLICGERFFKEISGVRAKGTVALTVNGKTAAKDGGELQFTDYGISGIPVFQISRYAVRALDGPGQRVEAVIDLMPEYDIAALSGYIKSQTEKNPGIPLAELLTGLVNKKLMALLIRLSGGSQSRLAGLIKEFRLTVTGSKGIENAQVCQGGIMLKEVELTGMESKLEKGLFFCGEMLDVDGICGGYNLQWAWSSGHLAGETAAKSVMEHSR